MTASRKYRSPLMSTARQAAMIIAAVSGIFSIAVSALLVVNYATVTAADHLNSPTLETLQTKLAQSPGDKDLKQEIRDRDLVERKAFFGSASRVRTGSLMLLAGAILFLASMKTAAELDQRLPSPTPSEEGQDPANRYAAARKMVVCFGVALVALLLLLSLSAPTPINPESTGTTDPVSDIDLPSNNWACFRGPGGNAIAHFTNAPTFWDGKTGKNILWKSPIPLPGFNSPIVWKNRIFLAGADDKTKEIYAFDATTGEELWRRCIAGIEGSPSEIPDVLSETGHAAATMTTDGKRVFAIFSNGDLICLDIDGTPIWSYALGIPQNIYGHSSSLIMYNHLLIVQFDCSNDARLLAFNGKTGEIVWDHSRATEISWASPILVNTGNRTELILNSLPFVSGHNPASGRELWSVECMDGDVAPSPAYNNGFVYVTSEYAVTAGIKLGETPAVIWEYENDLPDVSSPLATGNIVLTASSAGVITCLNAIDGTLHWMEEFDDGFYSSPVLVGDNVYLMDMTGLMRIFKASSEYQLLGQCELGEPSTCTPAFLDGRMYIRTEKNLYCIANERN